MSYENVWAWEGRTKESSVTTGRSITWPVDPFPFDDVINTTKIAILSEITAKFQEEFANLGITTTITKIEPEVWIETSRECRQFRDYTECRWYHWLHMKANVYFMSDKPVTESPIPPLILVALTKIITHLITVTATALVIYGIAVHFINTFFVETYTVETHNLETCQWTKETWTTPKLESAIVFAAGIGIVIAIGIGAYALTRPK